MPLKSTLFAISLIMPVGWAAAATTYQLKCGSAGSLQSIENRGQQIDTRTNGKTGAQIGVRSATDGFFSNRDSNQYDRAFFSKAIDAAVRAGVDPYYMLATLVVERPPHDYASASRVMPWETYYDQYGIPPVDATAAAAQLGCDISQKTKAEKQSNGVQHLHYTPRPPASARDIMRLGNPDTERAEMTVAILPFRTGQPPLFEIVSGVGECEQRCCTKIQYPKDWGQPETFIGRPKSESDPEAYYDKELGGKVVKTARIKPESLHHRILTQTLGAEFKNETFHRARHLYFVKRETGDPYRRLALKAQAYNGYGTVGATEKANSCINGLKGSESPIYGAGVMDLSLNMMMSNSEIREMVRAASERHDKPVKSNFCAEFGEGLHQIQPEGFSRIQQRLLVGRATCEKHTYRLRGDEVTSPKRTQIAEPATFK